MVDTFFAVLLVALGTIAGVVLGIGLVAYILQKRPDLWFRPPW